MRRINELIREVIGVAIQVELEDPRSGFVTVTAVDTSPDLRSARVYVALSALCIRVMAENLASSLLVSASFQVAFVYQNTAMAVSKSIKAETMATYTDHHRGAIIRPSCPSSTKL